ncbi:cytochrome c biogenesis CcdA family protein [Beijerinckia sp. L45]|uniref:cytochrome c biogenesis CcdA family protein n=1 Tax=Beijerinckia sp. L45 TaxID=1641855 RepID=UPI00131C8B9E|nr:cytochrome c biogenesis protein CcdA [Beijerinckia sp. L45]
MTLVLAFVAGLLTILSPCVLPLAPIVIAGARARGAAGPLMLAAGLALTFGIVGGALASAGIEAGDTAWVRVVSAIIMVLVGAAMLIPMLSHSAEAAMAPLAGWADRLANRLPAAGLIGQFAAGVVLAFAWAPCVGPTLGAAFALAASGGSLAAAMATMTVFALGAAISLLAVGYGLGRLALNARMLAGRAARIGRGALGAAFVIVGAIILTGFDRVVEASFVQAMPDWLVVFATRL